MIRVKICGITRLEDATEAVKLGVDALGFIFAPSPRNISPEKARDIIRSLPPFVKTVGVFVNQTTSLIRDTIDFCGLDLVQMHGDESPDQCEEFMPYSIKVFRMKNGSVVQAIKSYHGKIRAMLLDTYMKDKPGGTGKTFDWDLALKAKEYGIPIILSGGLGPENIEDAVKILRPYAVDVNSGVEEGPGEKSHEMLRMLFLKIHEMQSQSD
ncbi:MAG: phosphoribosylanthranilate isomerase [Deltaproteobacteria bacterium]|nr:phosphoribosylanthranilate isomerase [Deltaproteobacteria bacterium]